MRGNRGKAETGRKGKERAGERVERGREENGAGDQHHAHENHLQ